MNEEAFVAAGREQNFGARGEPSGAIGRSDDAGVFHLAGDQENVAAEGIDRAEILNRSGRTAGEMNIAAGEKFLVRDIERRGEETGGIDARLRADEDTVGIDQKNATVGLKCPGER